MAKKAIELKKLGNNNYFKTAIAIVLIVAIIGGFFFGMQLVLGSGVPIRVVESGSMCVINDGNCDGWNYPFDQALHLGDIIIIQQVNPADLNANYPNSDIIVYKNPNEATPIVHRIVSEENINGTIYFKTKGDGNGPVSWPADTNDYDNIPDAKGVPQNLVEGKVILRIPWFGWISLFVRGNSWVLPVAMASFALILVFAFVRPMVKAKRQNLRNS